MDAAMPITYVATLFVDGQAGADRATRGVDVQGDVPARVLGGEQHQFGADPVGQVVVDLLAEEDDPVPKQPLEQLVAERLDGPVGRGRDGGGRRQLLGGRPHDRRHLQVGMRGHCVLLA
jgi:hypothetical protein